MRVLFVTNGFPPRGRWGTEYYTGELAAGLVERGHEVAVLHPERSGARPHGDVERVEGAGGVPVFLIHSRPPGGFAASYADAAVERAFAGVLDEWRPDVAHFTYLLWGLSVRLPELSKARGVPSVVTLTDYGLLCHRGQMYDATLAACGGPHPAERCARCVREPSRYDVAPAVRPVKRALAHGLAALGLPLVVRRSDVEARERAVRSALHAAARLVAPTASMADAFARAGFDPARIERLCYAIRAEPYAAARRPPAGGVVRLGFLGQFAPHKGVATLLSAAEQLGGVELPDWELVLHGGPAGGRNRRFAGEVLGGALPPRVRVLPPFEPEDAGQVLASLGAVVVPSEWDENAPLTVLQARAAGVPVVGSDVPGIAEVVEEGVHGTLFPAGDATALAARMERVVRGDPWEGGRTGKSELPVSFDEHLRRVEAIYAEASG